MKYIDFINNILSTRGRFNCTGYKERHHILPRCLGGLDDEENLIDLYAQEHFIAHKLLAEENPSDRKLLKAFSMMGCGRENILILTEEDYEKVRLANSKSMVGKKFSDEVKNKLSKSHIEYFKTHEHPNKNKKLPEEWKNNLSISHFEYYKVNDGYWKDKKFSEEHRKHISESRIGNNYRAEKIYAIDEDGNKYSFESVKEARNWCIKELGIYNSVSTAKRHMLRSLKGGTYEDGFKWYKEVK